VSRAPLLTDTVGRCCSLIPGFGVKLSTIILAGPIVLSAVGPCPPHDGVRRRWRISCKRGRPFGHRKKSGDATTATVLAGTSFSAVSRESCGPFCSLRGSLLLGPVELSSVDPHSVQNDGELACNGDLGLAKPVALGEPHPQRLQCRPSRDAGQQYAGRFEQYMRSMASPHFEMRPDQSTSPEAWRRVVNPT
jgi:hypothetical protein